jgi:M6 family metalloprotease-like protein
MQAVPAHPGTVKVQQPDGSYITLRLVGDEWLSFNTTADGYSVVKDQRGYYVYAEQKDGRLQPTARVAHDESERSADEQAFLAGVKKYQAPEMDAKVAEMKTLVETAGAQRRAQGNRATNYSKFKGLIVLVQFNDKEFSRPDYKDIITDMVNKEDYSGFDGTKMTGSVRDYFSDNSGGKFKPQFDIAGPYTVDFSQYDPESTSNANKIILAAVDSANADVNYKDYDGDNDGIVDLVFFVIAGNGANYVGNDKNLWWPHRSYILEQQNGQYRYVYRDGVRLGDYASATELAGVTSKPSSVYIDGIGTICHEFSHVLGLPDFYDSNYEENGQSITPDEWSVMDQGCYLNKGYTPVGYSLYERYSVGFTDEPQKIEAEGSYQLEPLHTSYTGLRIDSPVNNEFFLLENRQTSKFKWDAYLPGSGMLVYRVDKTNNSVWQNNKVNATANRNYFELVRAGGQAKANTNYDPFPGRGNVTTLHHGTQPANLKTWSGKATKWGLFNIKMSKGVVSFDVTNALTLESLTLPEKAELPVGGSLQLTPVADPDYAEYTLTWKSDNPSIASVDKQGRVTGVTEGTCTITATSNNGKTASCQVSVINVPTYNIAQIKQLPVDTEVLLDLLGAEVTYVNGTQVYIRDASGAIILKNMNLGLKRNDIVNGMLYAKVGVENMMPLLSATDATSAEGLTITAGSGVTPREVRFEDLTEADYADFVLVKAVKLVQDGGVYAVGGDNRARLWNKFNIKNIKVPSNYDGKYFDVKAIYGTDIINGTVIDELYLMDSLTEVEAPTGIVEMRQDIGDKSVPVYNLHGQRVSPTTKGLLIYKGRKLLNR